MSIYDILPDFGSYMADMEQCLMMDPKTWAEYRNNPVPFLTDLLCDFGKFDEETVKAGACHVVAKEAAEKWAHPNVGRGVGCGPH